MKKKGKKSKVIALEKKQSYVLMIISVVVGFFIWWQIINRWIDHLYWPSIPSIIHSLVQIRSNILLYIGASIYRTILGYVLGCSLGILIAYAMSLSRVVDAVITPYIEILRPIPALALIPFFILWFGIGDLGKVLMISMGTFVVMVITTREGIHQLDRVYVRAATVLGATRWSIYKSIIFPGSLPSVMGGLRVNAALSFGMMIASEFLGAKSGLGYLIIVARRTMKTEVMLLSVIIIGLLSFLFDRLVVLIGRYVTRWMPE